MNPHTYSQSMKTPFNDIVIGLIMMMIGTLGRQVFKMDEILIVLGIISWFFILRGILRLPLSSHANYFSYSYRLLLFFYILICVVMIIRGYFIDYRYQWTSSLSAIRFHLFDQYYILPYIMPVVVLIPYRYYRFDLIVKLSIILAVASIVLFSLFSSEIILHSVLEEKGRNAEGLISGKEIVLYGKLSFIALCSCYLTKREWLFNIIGLAFVTLTLLIAARRGSSFTYVCILLFSLYTYSKNNNLNSKILVLVFLIAGFYFVMNSELLNYLYSRGFEDTHTSIQKAMLSQMSDFEKFFGQGLNGRYYFRLREHDYLDGWRYGIETGFYNLVLKGGYLMAFTYILLLAIPAYKGLFKSNNQLCQAGGFYILLSLFELFPWGWLTFDIKFLIIWIMIVICMNPELRLMDNQEIEMQFFPTK